jgi:hypothetical protein
MKHESKLTSHEQARLEEVKAQQTTAREFTSVEEVLRHDAGQTVVPPGIAERLARSVQNVPPPERAWWQRWLKP